MQADYRVKKIFVDDITGDIIADCYDVLYGESFEKFLGNPEEFDGRENASNLLQDSNYDISDELRREIESTFGVREFIDDQDYDSYQFYDFGDDDWDDEDEIDELVYAGNANGISTEDDEDFTIPTSLIRKESFNLREALNTIDLNTYNKYDLLNLYESCNLSENEKRALANIVYDQNDPEVIYDTLNDRFVTGKEVEMPDRVKDGVIHEDVEDDEYIYTAYDIGDDPMETFTSEKDAMDYVDAQEDFDRVYKVTKRVGKREIVIYREDDEDEITPNLPKEVEISIYDVDYVEGETDTDELDDTIGDYLSNNYGFCHYGFEFDVNGDTIYVYNIEWDTSESVQKSISKSINESNDVPQEPQMKWCVEIEGDFPADSTFDTREQAEQWFSDYVKKYNEKHADDEEEYTEDDFEVYIYQDIDTVDKDELIKYLADYFEDTYRYEYTYYKRFVDDIINLLDDVYHLPNYTLNDMESDAYQWAYSMCEILEDRVGSREDDDEWEDEYDDDDLYESKYIKESFHKDGWVLRYDNGDHYVYWTADDDYTPDITNPKIMIYDSEDMALSDISDVKKIYAELTDYEDAIFEPVHTSELSTNESKSIKESGISEVEPVVKFKGKSSHTFTPNKKWEVDFDEEGNILARTRHGKPYYFSGHINDKTNEFGHTDEDAIIQAAREQHKSKFGKDDSINESADSMIYLFPELTDEDLEMAKGYGLTFLGKNHGADGSEDNWVLRGAESSLRMFADKYLGYELHPDYLYEIDDFAGDIVNESKSLTEEIQSPLRTCLDEWNKLEQESPSYDDAIDAVNTAEQLVGYYIDRYEEEAYSTYLGNRGILSNVTPEMDKEVINLFNQITEIEWVGEYVPTPNDMGTYFDDIQPELEESVKKSLTEGFYRGCKGVTMIGHGSWSDPELEYNGYLFNYWDIEDALWDAFLDETGYSDAQSDDPKVEEEFNAYVKEICVDYLNECIYGGAFTGLSIEGDMIDFPNGEYYYVGYNDGKISLDSAYNAGRAPEYSIDYDFEESIDTNLQRLYDHAIEKTPWLNGDDDDLDESVEDDLGDDELNAFYKGYTEEDKDENSAYNRLKNNQTDEAYNKLIESAELSTDQAVMSTVDQIKMAYEAGLFDKLPIGRKNAATTSIYGPDKERLVGYFKKQPEFNYEMNTEGGIMSHEFISDKLDIEIFDEFISIYRIPQNESVEKVYTKKNGDYLVKGDNGGYQAFSKDDVHLGHIDEEDPQEAQFKFDKNKFTESKSIKEETTRDYVCLPLTYDERDFDYSATDDKYLEQTEYEFRIIDANEETIMQGWVIQPWDDTIDVRGGIYQVSSDLPEEIYHKWSNRCEFTNPRCRYGYKFVIDIIDNLTTDLENFYKKSNESKSITESEEDKPYTKEEVERDLKSLTHNFTDKEGDLKCGFEEEKKFGVEILRQHYKIVEVSGDDRREGTWYHISFAEPKNLNDEPIKISSNSKMKEIDIKDKSEVGADGHPIDRLSNYSVGKLK